MVNIHTQILDLILYVFLPYQAQTDLAISIHNHQMFITNFIKQHLVALSNLTVVR